MSANTAAWAVALVTVAGCSDSRSYLRVASVAGSIALVLALLVLAWAASCYRRARMPACLLLVLVWCQLASSSSAIVRHWVLRSCTWTDDLSLTLGLHLLPAAVTGRWQAACLRPCQLGCPSWVPQQPRHAGLPLCM